MIKIRILVACEESQRVTSAFRSKGHDAYSCDIMECSGGHPKWHLRQDVLPLLEEKWDMIIAFPPCTHLCCASNRWAKQKIENGDRKSGIDFFMKFANIPNDLCSRIAIENPVGIMSTFYRKPDQIINPWQFGDPYSKRTCLWLRGLPLLTPTKIVDKGEKIVFKGGKSMQKWYADAYSLPKAERSKVRSKTFPGIANAMASQWG